MSEFHKPGVVAGFEPLDILLALRDLVRMTVEGSPKILNDYKRVVRSDGTPTARKIVEEVFEPSDASWRGLGLIPGSGLALQRIVFPLRCHCCIFRWKFPMLRMTLAAYARRYSRAAKTPDRCGLFGKECTPEDPVGPCMVSSEGTCAAYYNMGRPETMAKKPDRRVLLGHGGGGKMTGRLITGYHCAQTGSRPIGSAP